MSLYDDDRYSWRETYFVLFEPQRRPRLAELRRELRPLKESVKIVDAETDDVGFFTKLTVASYEDHSALEIVFRQGADVAAEMNALFRVLGEGCSGKEKERLETACRQAAKFDVLHFEQTAGTGAFNVVKRPELEFSPKGIFTQKKRAGSPKKKRTRFHFDPNSFEKCRTGSADVPFDAEESSVERVDPKTLVLVLGILCRLTDGVAIDPASGCGF